MSSVANPVSLRSMIRVALISLGLTATGADVENHVRKNARSQAKKDSLAGGEDTMQVQIAQVRTELLASVGVNVQRGRGRPSATAAGEIARKLALPSVQKRIAALKAA